MSISSQRTFRERCHHSDYESLLSELPGTSAAVICYTNNVLIILPSTPVPTFYNNLSLYFIKWRVICPVSMTWFIYMVGKAEITCFVSGVFVNVLLDCGDAQARTGMWNRIKTRSLHLLYMLCSQEEALRKFCSANGGFSVKSSLHMYTHTHTHTRARTHTHAYTQTAQMRRLAWKCERGKILSETDTAVQNHT